MSGRPLVARALIVGLLAGLAGCSFVLDFDDQCAIDTDCDSGQRCDRGLCVERVLLTPAGPCDQLLGADPREAAPEDVLLVGALLPRTGALSSVGPGMQNGIAMAVEEINQIGGVLGRKIGVVACDSGSDASQALVAARHLVDSVGVEVIIGAGASGVTIDAFSQVAKAAGVLMVSPSATSPAITDLPDGGLLWRVAPSDAIQGKAIAGLLLNELSATKIAVVNRDDAYGNGLARVVQQEICRSLACTTESFRVAIYPADTRDPSFDSRQAEIIAELQSFTPEVVVLVSFVDDGLAFLRRAQGMGLRFVLTDGTKDVGLLPPNLTDTALLCGILGTSPGRPDPTAFAPFEAKYAARYGGSAPIFSAHAYDAAYLVGLAWAATSGAGLAPSDVDGYSLAEGLRRLSSGAALELGPGDWGKAVTALSLSADATVNIEGVSGPLDFDGALGEAPGAINLWRLDLDADAEAGKIAELGVVLDAEGRYLSGVDLSRPLGHSCNSAR